MVFLGRSVPRGLNNCQKYSNSALNGTRESPGGGNRTRFRRQNCPGDTVVFGDNYSKCIVRGGNTLTPCQIPSFRLWGGGRGEKAKPTPCALRSVSNGCLKNSCLTWTALPSKAGPITTSRALPGTIRRGLAMFLATFEVPRPETAKQAQT